LSNFAKNADPSYVSNFSVGSTGLISRSKTTRRPRRILTLGGVSLVLDTFFSLCVLEGGVLLDPPLNFQLTRSFVPSSSDSLDFADRCVGEAGVLWGRCQVLPSNPPPRQGSGDPLLNGTGKSDESLISLRRTQHQVTFLGVTRAGRTLTIAR